MKVKILLNLGSDLPPYKQDEEVDVEEELGNRLIRMGVARDLSPVRVENPIDEGDWKDMASPKLEIDEATAKILNDSGLGTAGLVADRLAREGSLTSVDGIGAGREKSIREALRKLSGQV